jgi:hypothetical protein
LPRYIIKLGALSGLGIDHALMLGLQVKTAF